jgi:prepilin-type processing-associated H-X9-DG protein
VELPAETELVTEADLEQDNDFSRCVGGWPQPHRSPHLSGGNPTVPDGGNMGFVDGHVRWRPFGDMQERWGSSPGYWW